MFDEIHKVITDIGYREVFQAFGKLRLVGCQITGMTASLGPHLLPAFFELTRIDTWEILRMPSARPNLQYSVCVTTEKTIRFDIHTYLAKRTRLYAEKDRAIVFCRTIDDADLLAKRLKVIAFHSRNANTNEKVYGEWLSGQNCVMVSTSILGCGLDYPSIRDVIHYELGYTILDQYQEECRGGRDGLPARAVTFVTAGFKTSYKKQPYDLGSRDLLPAALSTEKCRRLVPSMALDGVATTCTTLAGAIYCDNCEALGSKPLPLRPAVMPIIEVPRPSRADRVAFAVPDIPHSRLPRIQVRSEVPQKGGSR